MGWTYAFPKPYELESFRESYSYVDSPDKISTLQFHQKREVKWKVMHWRSGSRPWTLCSCPWTRCRTYHEASCNNIIPLVITSSCIYAWSFATVVPTMIVFLWFHFSDKLKHLSSADQCIFANLYLDLPSSITLRYLENNKELCCFLWVFIRYCSSAISDCPGFWVISHSGTPISESIPHSDSIALRYFRFLRV